MITYVDILSDYFIIYQSLAFEGISVVCLGFVIDAFRRLVKCLEHDKLGISKL